MNRTSQINCGRAGSFPVQTKLCFACSNDSVPVEVAALVLQIQGFANSTEERQTIVQVMCQLLRVQWESVAEVMTLNDGKIRFCITCFKVMTEIILLREKLFQIECEIRGKLKEIEDSVVISWTEGGHSLEEPQPFPGICQDFRTTFQRQIMQEVWSKELMQQKVAELQKTSNNLSVNLKPSMVQLHFTKNVFAIKKKKLTEMPSITEDKTVKIDEIVLDSDDSEVEMPATDTRVGFALVPASPYLADSENEVCPRKKSKDDKIEKTPPTSVPVPRIAHDDFISSLSNSTPQKAKPFTSQYREFEIVKTSSPDKPIGRTSLGKPMSNRVESKASHRKSISPKSPSAKTGTMMMIRSAKKESNNRNAVKPIRPKSTSNANSPIMSDLSETDDEKDGSDKDDDDWIDDNDKMCVDSDMASDDSDELSDETAEGDVDSANQQSDDEESIEFQETSKALVLASEFCKKQRFNPKRAYGYKKKASASTTEILDQIETTFEAKDKTIWTTKPPSKTRKVREYEVLRERGGLIGPAKNTKLTPVEIFKLMFPPSIVETIVKHTNALAEHVEKQRSSPSLVIWYPVTVDEIYAYIGILLHLGVEKKRNFNVKEIWTTNQKYAIPSIVATMSKTRFQHIQRYFRFDDSVARKACAQAKRPNDDAETKRSYISELLDPFVEVMQSHLSPYDTLVLDEMLVKFRGHSKFRVYMKSKPGKYGMKFWAVCDVETGYILNISLYQGKIGDTVAKELGKSVVLDLVKKYFNSGRAVTMDNFFTSKALGEELMKHKMSMLGTLNRNRMDVIPEFVDPNKREIQSSVFAFQGDFTMVSYIQRKNRAAILLSTQHHLAEICPGIKNKPQMILDYNATKGGVDTADQMIATYSCQRTTKRWPVKVFYALLDIAALNAYIVHQLHTSLDKESVLLTRITFLRSICENLMEPLIAARVNKYPNFNMPREVYKALARLGYEKKEKLPLLDGPQALAAIQGRLATKNRCGFCPPPSRTQKSSRSRCSSCLRFACGDHHKIYRFCKDCEPANIVVPEYKPIQQD